MSQPKPGHEPMSPLDELLFRNERDPDKRSTLAVVHLLDRAPDWSEVEYAFERASREFLRLRQRVVEPTGGFGPAFWATDPDFDLAYHLRRMRLAPGATLADVLAWLEPELTTPLDAARPLWRASLFEGIEGERAALVMTVSHAVSDGVGGVALHGILFDAERAAPRRPMPPAPLATDASPDELAGEELGRLALHMLDFATRFAGQISSVADRLRESPRAVLDDLVARASSALRVLDSGAPHSPLLAGRSRKRRLLWREISLDRLRASAKAAGGTINDAYLAGLCGALARYHDALFMPVGTLPLGIPISTRGPHGADPTGGNRFVAAVLAAPLSPRDPAARMKAIAEQLRTIRAEPGIDYADWAAPWLAALPAPLSARVMGTIRAPDVQASNVPGPRTPLHLGGARVDRILGIGPLPGAAMMATLFTHGRRASLTIHYDPAALREPELFERCLAESFAEIDALAQDFGRADDALPTEASPADPAPARNDRA